MEIAAILATITTIMPIVALGAIALWVFAVIMRALYNYMTKDNRAYPVYVQPPVRA